MSQMNTLTQKELVKRYLIGAAEPLSIKQIATATGVNNGSVGSLIYRFRADGLIESIDNGATQAATHFWIGSTALNETDTPTDANADTCCGQCTGNCSEVEQGAYHGMTERNPDDAPEIVFESYRDSLIASLNAAETALVVYRKRRRIDPIEAGLLAAIEALEATLKGACHD